MRLPDFEAWAIFARVAELGSFAQAARDLQLSPPTISKAIGRLEQSLGVALFTRNSRQMSMTQAGRRALERVSQMVQDITMAEAEARGGRAQPSGLIRVTAPTSFGIRHLAPVLPDFLRAWPDIDLSIRYTDAIMDLVAGGYDLAIRIAALTDSTLRARKICRVRRVLVATPDYLVRTGRPRHPRDLEGRKSFFYLNSPAPGAIRLTHDGTGESYVLSQSARMQSDNSDGFLPALYAGLGFGQFPDFMISEAVRAGQLEIMLPKWRVEDIDLYLVTPATNLRPQRVNLLMEHLAEVFGHPSWQLPE